MHHGGYDGFKPGLRPGLSLVYLRLSRVYSLGCLRSIRSMYPVIHRFDKKVTVRRPCDGVRDSADRCEREQKEQKRTHLSKKQAGTHYKPVGRDRVYSLGCLRSISHLSHLSARFGKNVQDHRDLPGFWSINVQESPGYSCQNGQ